MVRLPILQIISEQTASGRSPKISAGKILEIFPNIRGDYCLEHLCTDTMIDLHISRESCFFKIKEMIDVAITTII